MTDRSIDRELAAHISTALGMLGDSASSAALLPWVRQTRDPGMHVRATQGLLMFHCEETVPLLLQELESARASQALFGATIYSLGLSSDARALPALIACAENADERLPDISRAAAIFNYAEALSTAPAAAFWRHSSECRRSRRPTPQAKRKSRACSSSASEDPDLRSARVSQSVFHVER